MLCRSGNGFQAAISGERPRRDPSTDAPGFRLKLTKPLPKTSVVQKNPLVQAWMVQLDDGSICKPYMGTLPIIPDKTGGIKAVRYSCSDTNTIMTGLLDGSMKKSGGSWTAQKIFYSRTPTDLKIEKIFHNRHNQYYKNHSN